VFGGNNSDGFLDWLIDECEARRRPGVGQLAAEFERRYLGRPVPQGSLLEAMKTVWEGIVVIKVREYLSDPVASAVVRAAKKPRGQLSSYEKRLMRKVLLTLHRNKKKQATFAPDRGRGWRGCAGQSRYLRMLCMRAISWSQGGRPFSTHQGECVVC
jgi:hypothetical protein